MKFRVVIAGAGISGLALGWYLKKALGGAIDLTILDGSSRSGGWIRTDFDKGFLFEAGPRSCRTKGAGRATLELVESLGLQEEVIVASEAAKRRYIYYKGKLQPLPDGIVSFLASPLMKGMVRALWRDWRAERGSGEDETVADFFGRRLGVPITERLIDPLVSGIFAGDIGSLSVRSCFPDIYRKEQEHGSLILGMLKGKKKNEPASPFVEQMSRSPIFSFKNGMETLIYALQADLKEHIRLSDKAAEILQAGDGLNVITDKGESYPADRIYLALPAHAASELVRGISREASGLMSAIPSASVAVVNMGWNTRMLDREGFGYLIPRSEKEDILGVVWDSSAFPQQNAHPGQTRLTVMLGGICHPDMCSQPSEYLTETALKAVRNHLGISIPPESVRVTVAHEAIPQYMVGHSDKVDKIEKALEKDFRSRVCLVGSPWRGVAVNECILDANTAASALIAECATLLHS